MAPGGLRAAHAIAEIGGKAVLIEQRGFLGGAPIAENYAGLTPHGEPAEPQIRRMIDLVTSHPGADVRLGTEVQGAEGEGGRFSLRLRGPDGEQLAECGAVIIATGFSHFDPGRETQMYGYYEFPDVIALQDLEPMLKQHNVLRPSNGQPPERVCFIQCVGSRDRHIGNEYCSKVCCGVASKEAIEIRLQLPGTKVFIFYIDMRMYGYWENQIYWPAQEDYHVQYIKGIITEVLKKGDKLLVRGEDTTIGPPDGAGDGPGGALGRDGALARYPQARQPAECPAEQVRLHRGGGQPARPGVDQPGRDLRLRRGARPRRPGGHRLLSGGRGHEGGRLPAVPGRRGALSTQVMMAGPVVDTPSAQEFQREILDRISPAELAAIAADLSRKSGALRGLLAPGAARLDQAALRQVLRWVFGARRHADQILDAIGPQRLGAAITALLDPAEAVTARFDAFDALLAGLPGPGFDLPGELLHFVNPSQYWLWTRWLWNPSTETGALRLVTTDDIDLTEGGSRGEVYLTVGRATTFVDETGKAAGFTGAGPGLFGADVYLAAVYGVYMYTVLRMRMTQEFNRLLPPLPSLIRRLLGVYHLEV